MSRVERDRLVRSAAARRRLAADVCAIEGSVTCAPALRAPAPGGSSAKLDTARRSRAEATTDFERVRLRDEAKAVEAAAPILECKDLQIETSFLAAEAERALNRANPPKGRGKQQGGVVPDHAVCGDVMRQIRSAHRGFEDSGFEAAKTRAGRAGEGYRTPLHPARRLTGPTGVTPSSRAETSTRGRTSTAGRGIRTPDIRE